MEYPDVPRQANLSHPHQMKEHRVAAVSSLSFLIFFRTDHLRHFDLHAASLQPFHSISSCSSPPYAHVFIPFPSICHEYLSFAPSNSPLFHPSISSSPSSSLLLFPCVGSPRLDEPPSQSDRWISPQPQILDQTTIVLFLFLLTLQYSYAMAIPSHRHA